MSLVYRYSSFPGGHPNREVFAVRSNGEILTMGRHPRLTMGERMFGRYAEFLQVDMTEQQAVRSQELRSATGDFRFRTRIAVTYEVEDALSTAQDDRDPEYFVLNPVMEEAAEEAARYDRNSYFELQTHLKEIFCPTRAGIRKRGPYRIVRVSPSVDPPAGFITESELISDVSGIHGKIAAAHARNDPEQAAAFLRAKEFMDSTVFDDARQTIGKAEMALQLQGVIRELVDAGVGRKDSTVRTLEQQRRQLTGATAEDEIEDGRRPENGRPADEAADDID